MIIIKKIIPFKKDILFNTNIGEITSISLDHELSVDDNLVTGKFIVSGEYKESIDTENVSFNYTLPFTVYLDSKYLIDKATLDIDDFYYEIKDNTLIVSIDILIDNIEIKEEPIIENKRCIEEEEPPKIEETKTIINDEEYKSYTVYIVREGDNIESILKKYNTTREILDEYNDLSNINIGDKIIIPS
ncbi:MAG: LysM peptidoglycan-binding domain-containing protein [Bacilli bacterium]|nr:LysM peptidoglycan-binding domain-containing protein [Bacilli bacterium]